MASAPGRFLVAVCLPVCVVLARDCEGSCGAADATLLHQRAISRNGLSTMLAGEGSTVGDPPYGSDADGTIQLSSDNVVKLLLSTREQVEKLLKQPPVPDLAKEEDVPASPSEVQWDSVQQAVQDASTFDPHQLFELPEVQVLSPQVKTVMKHSLKSMQHILPKMGTTIHQEIAKWEEWSKDPKLESMLMKVAERLGVANGGAVPMDDAERIATDMLAEIPALATFATRPKRIQKHTKEEPEEETEEEEKKKSGLEVSHGVAGGIGIGYNLACGFDTFSCTSFYFKVCEDAKNIGFPAGVIFSFKHVALKLGAWSQLDGDKPTKFSGGFEFAFNTFTRPNKSADSGTTAGLWVSGGPAIKSGKGSFAPTIVASVAPPNSAVVGLRTTLTATLSSGNSAYITCILVKMGYSGGKTTASGIHLMKAGYTYADR